MPKQAVINSTRESDQPVGELMRARLAARAQGRLEVLNQTGPKATIRIYDYLDFLGITAEDVAQQLDQITADEIEVQINSPGGVSWEGIAIYNALRAHPARITTRVDGIAASAASVVAQAGDHRVMLTGSQMMVHEAHGVCIGGAEDMRQFADLIDQQNDIIAGIYANHSGRPVEEMRQLMADETWMKHDGAVEAGLADEVIDPTAKPAKNDDDEPEASINVDDLVTKIAAALRPQIPDAPAAPGVTPPGKDGGHDPDAATAASETDLLHALHGALTQETNQ